MHLLERGFRIGVLAIDLVDHDDDPQPDLEGLPQYEPRLRHRALGGVDEEQAAVGHVEHALDLSSEVGMAGRVDDVDGHLAVANRGVLDQSADLLVVAEGVALLQERVDQGRLAVVDVGDDRHVPDVVADFGHWTWQYTGTQCAAGC